MASLCLVLTSHAQTTYQWSPDGVTPNGGGTGTFANNTNVWHDGSAFTDFLTLDDSAFNLEFGGTAGTVTQNFVSYASTANQIRWLVDGYTLASSGTAAVGVGNGAQVLSAGVTLNVNEATAGGSRTFIMGGASGGAGSKIVFRTNSTANRLTTLGTGTGGTGVFSVPIEIEAGNAAFHIQAISGNPSAFNNGFTGTITNNSGHDILMSSSAAVRTLFFQGNIVGAGGLNLGLSNQVFVDLNYAGTMSYTGATRFTGTQSGSDFPTIRLHHANVLPTNTAVIFGDPATAARGGRLQLNGFNVQVGSLESVNSAIGFVENASNTSATLTVGGSSTTTYGLLLQDGTGTGTLGLTRSGDGATILTGDNTYTGATLVTGSSMLIINGDQTAATGSVTVDSLATLGGSGIIGGATTINGTLSPGNSTGVLEFASSLTLAGTADFEIEGLARATQYDGVDVGGLLTYGGDLVLNLTGTYTPTTSWNLFNFGSFGGNFTSVELTGDYAGSLAFSGGIWSGTVGGEDWEFDLSNGTLQVVPEPSTVGLITIGLMTLLLRCRRS